MNYCKYNCTISMFYKRCIFVALDFFLVLDIEFVLFEIHCHHMHMVYSIQFLVNLIKLKIMKYKSFSKTNFTNIYLNIFTSLKKLRNNNQANYAHLDISFKNL